MVLNVSYENCSDIKLFIDDEDLKRVFGKDNEDSPITFKEIIDKLIKQEEQIVSLKEKIYNFEHPDDGSDYEYECWKEKDL